MFFIYLFVETSNFLGKYSHIHFVGIGGISMSALAKICFSNGVCVTGSDKAQTDVTRELTHIGIKVFLGHSKKNIAGADLVVYTCAVGDCNQEVAFARKCGVEVLERADFLGKITQEFQNVIAIAGSHGKTTVCAMLASIFVCAGKNPTVLVGGQTNQFGNLLIGGQDFLILEACEYMSHFLKLKRTTCAILNIDYDHPDFFKSKSQYANAFFDFAQGAKNVVTSEKLKMFAKSPITFGSFGNFESKNAKLHDGMSSFDVQKDGKFFLHVNLHTVSDSNIQNSLCAIAIADFYGIWPSQIADGLAKYSGVKRRFEYMGKFGTNDVICDYAHHPTQIKDCILSTRKICKSKKIVVVFEPHTFSRTKFLFADFVSALSFANEIVLLPTYSAREKPIDGGKSQDIYKALKFNKKMVHFKASYASCQKFLKRFSNCIILILGAGSVINMAESIKKNYILHADN